MDVDCGSKSAAAKKRKGKRDFFTSIAKKGEKVRGKVFFFFFYPSRRRRSVGGGRGGDMKGEDDDNSH